MKEFLDVPENWVVMGVLTFIIVRWFIQSQKKEEHKTHKTWRQWLKNERNDWVICAFGAFIFYFIGDGLMTGACDVMPFVGQEACISAYVNASEFLFMMGGALFGPTLPFAYKYYQNKKAKKLKNE